MPDQTVEREIDNTQQQSTEVAFDDDKEKNEEHFL